MPFVGLVWPNKNYAYSFWPVSLASVFGQLFCHCFEASAPPTTVTNQGECRIIDERGQDARFSDLAPLVRGRLAASSARDHRHPMLPQSG
jgi:hypothetical protein